MFRDIKTEATRARSSRAGRNVIAVIGIDRYQKWQRLNNAVSDARGALQAFLRLGFEQVAPPLYDEAATSDAIRSLVRDDLAGLDRHDSLVVFFAGHGHTVTRTFQEGDSVKTGYIIPVDGDPPGGSTVEWLRLDAWLSDVARLEAKHILVFLDACHSGIALGSLVKWRDAGQRTESFERLGRRRSRRVITSAQDDQRALDGGPLPGHSLFTGCLIEGLNGGMAPHGALVSGSQIGLYLQERVTSYPQSEQTPDFGALEEDKRGELLIRVATEQATELSIAQDRVELDHVAAVSNARPRLATGPSAPVPRSADPPPAEAPSPQRAQRQPIPRASRRGRWRLLASVVVLAAAMGLATSGADKPDPAARALSRLRELRDAMCLCKDGPCTEKLTADLARWQSTARQAAGKRAKLVEDDRRVASVADEIGKCKAAILAASAPSPKLPRIELVDTVIGASVDGARVEIAGTNLAGPAPFTAKLEKGRPYRARITARGFAALELGLKGGDDKPATRLVAKPRVLSIVSDPPGAMIRIDGQATGHTTPHDVELTTAQAAKKTVRVQLRKAGYRVLERPIDLGRLTEDDARMIVKINEKLGVLPRNTPSPAPPPTPAAARRV